jgi:hypothetical protein
MKMIWSVFGLAAFLGLLYLTYSMVMNDREVQEIQVACCGDHVKVNVIRTQRRYFGSPHFGWGGGGHKTWVDVEGLDDDWAKDGRWWPFFLSIENKKIILCAKQYLVKPVRYEIFQYENNEWKSLSAFPADLNIDADQLRQSTAPFLAKMESSDQVAVQSWLNSVLVKMSE